MCLVIELVDDKQHIQWTDESVIVGVEEHVILRSSGLSRQRANASDIATTILIEQVDQTESIERSQPSVTIHIRG